jgi:predicted ATPase/class 3 adenylate cyclase
VRALPTGTITFYFSDIEGSTRLLESLGDAYPPLLERQRTIARTAFERHGGTEVGTQGDSFFAVFPTASAAVDAAIEVQRALGAEPWPPEGDVRVRIGLHAGEGIVVADDYVGIDVHRAARVMSAGHGGQILVSAAAAALLAPAARDGFDLRDLGEHRLKDLSAPERLFQVVAAGLADAFPGVRGIDTVPNNLPAHVPRLVGRDRERQDVADLLGRARLVTLTGPGGIGKTTLALHVAADAVEQYPDGLWFIDLSGASDGDAVLGAIAKGVGVPVRGSDSLRDAIVAALAGKQMLVVLDNFEQVVAAAPDVATLLAKCSDVTFLVTSREALRVRGEQVLPIAPLALPEPGGGRPTATSVARSEAAALFLERARAARPDFELTDANAVAVAEIVARLDGLPLAIELAAARLRLFSLDELHERLRLELLRGGARDLPARQRTLRGAIDWSYDLLDEDERRVFAFLSVFSTARIEAVEAVAESVPGLDEVDVIDRLASLVDKSLVRSVEDGGRQRLSMLLTINEYAAERLAERRDLAAAARRAHAEYFAAFAADRRATLRGSGRTDAQDELAADLANVMAAWRFYVDGADVARLSAMLDPLWALHEARGWYHAAVALTNDVLDALARVPPSERSPESEIALRLGLARGLLAIRGYRPEVETLYREALALTEAAGVPRQLAVLRSLASFHLARGEIDRTAEIGRQILELGEREGDAGIQVEGLVVLGPVTTMTGDHETGMAHLDRAAALFDPETHGRWPLRLGPSPGVVAFAIGGLLRWVLGYPDSADRYAASALEIAARLGSPYSLAYATFHVALLDLWNRRLESAQARARTVRAIADERDYPVWQATSRVLEGVTAAFLGDPGDGLALVERGISLYENAGAPPIFWPQLLSLRARACTAVGRPDEGLRAVDEAIVLAGPEDAFDRAPLLVQAGDLLVALGDPEAAESRLEDARAIAALLGARMIELQALTRLAGLAPTGADAAGLAARAAALEAVLGSLTEGAGSPDIAEARAALEALRAAVG